MRRARPAASAAPPRPSAMPPASAASNTIISPGPDEGWGGVARVSMLTVGSPPPSSARGYAMRSTRDALTAAFVVDGSDASRRLRHAKTCRLKREPRPATVLRANALAIAAAWPGLLADPVIDTR